MSWYRIKHKETGEIQFVLDPDNYDSEKWESISIKGNRSPKPFESVDDEGHIFMDEKLKAASISLEEKFKLLETRVLELEKLVKEPK